MTSRFKKGFSIVEMLVAVALFSAVALMSIASLFALADANEKARSARTAMDSIGYMFDGMVREIRLGSKYYCQQSATPAIQLTSGLNVQKCEYVKNNASSGGLYLLFRDRIGKIMAYRFANNCIERKTTDVSWSTSYGDNLSGYSCLTSSNITIERFRFYVYGTDPIPSIGSANYSDINSYKQPYVVISATIKVGTKAKTLVSFPYQTTVSQRIPHNIE